MSIVETIAAAVKPWNDLYAGSKAVSASVTFLHVGSLLVGGGLAIASDRAALRMRSADPGVRRHLLEEFAAVHRPVMVAIAVMVVSGVAMLLADVETFLVSPVYWTKMGFFVVLLANGWFVKKTEERLRTDPVPSNPRWRLLNRGAVTSITLWITTTLLGVVVMSN